jgi:hypothetical protein
VRSKVKGVIDKSFARPRLTSNRVALSQSIKACNLAFDYVHSLLCRLDVLHDGTVTSHHHIALGQSRKILRIGAIAGRSCEASCTLELF